MSRCFTNTKKFVGQDLNDLSKDRTFQCSECESEDQCATVVPAKKMLRRDSLSVTLDDWHRALGFHKCATCGAPTGNGIRYVWQGRNRWCEECFWGDDSQSAISDVPTDFDAPEKENRDADHRGN